MVGKGGERKGGSMKGREGGEEDFRVLSVPPFPNLPLHHCLLMKKNIEKEMGKLKMT